MSENKNVVLYIHAGRGLSAEHVFSFRHEFSSFVFVDGHPYATVLHWLFSRSFTFKEGLKMDWANLLNILDCGVLLELLSNVKEVERSKTFQENIDFLGENSIVKERSSNALQEDLCAFAQAMVEQHVDEITTSLKEHTFRFPAFQKNESITWSNAQHFYFEFCNAHYLTVLKSKINV